MLHSNLTRRAYTGLIAVLICFVLIGCFDDDDNNSRGGGGGSGGTAVEHIAFVTTTDFTSGSYSSIDLDDLSTSINLPSANGIVESDNGAVFFNGKVYIINRLGFDNITVLDTADLTRAVSQFSAGNGSNPQDMAFVSDTKAYVSLLAENNLLIVDPTDAGQEIKGTIDLGPFVDAADPDDIVEAKDMVLVGDRLFVALQRLDRTNFFAVVADAVLAVIDTKTDTLVDVDPSATGVQGITLTGRNPVYMYYDSGLAKIVVSEVGSYFANDGGIETVDADTLQAEGFIVDEATIGGDVGDVRIVNGTKGYVVYSIFSGGVFSNLVAIFDLNAGTKTGELTVNSSFIPSLALDDDNRLLVPDRSLTDPGIRIFDTDTDAEVTGAPLNVGLPPSTILVFTVTL